ncbi:MAG: universal stress protein [Cocleimonas sp.]
MYKHILYATDFSKASLSIEKKVENMTTQLDAQLSVIHVVNFGSTVWMGGGGYFVLAQHDDETMKDSKTALKVCEDRINIDLRHTTTVQGSPKEEIVSYAEKIGADLVVLGSHGHRHVSDLLGTTATGVLHRAKCDVLVIHSGEDD